MRRGTPSVQIDIPRWALEQFEHHPDGAAQMLAAVRFSDAAGQDRHNGLSRGIYPAFRWHLAPYSRALLFSEPNTPLLFDVGLEFAAQWSPAPGVFAAGALRQGIWGNLDHGGQYSDSVLPHVRSDANFYEKSDGPVLEHMTAAYYYRPGPDVYGRFTAGYLERMYGGVSAELLWKPVGGRLGLGAEINWAAQRSFDGLGFAPLTISANPDTIGPSRSYDVFTGHLSVYYEHKNNFYSQVHLGRYLAGDWGVTLALDREFDNGWKMGAWATLSDASSANFGGGSFDKGLHITIPLSWQLGAPLRRTGAITIQPVLRDGGARLRVQDRLYDILRGAHQLDKAARWGGFWR